MLKLAGTITVTMCTQPQLARSSSNTSHDSDADDGYWVMPAPPPLYKAPVPGMPQRRTPRYVFGWAFTHEDQYPEVVRVSLAWSKIRVMLPKNVRRVAAVRCIRDGEETAASCIYIGTNLSKEQMIRAQDEDFIGRVWDLLDTHVDPDWHVRIS
ncbi:hypothetical protein CPB84DRAFT_1791783 [Gymnopilus junonius]|uniref:Uncharacterized protein n=1 Tax=Gymnopilus junonius TaxID=109634 RepID=A0A9P5TJ60_GYMJU|nr:hypothetical protein CPB84DRAFT_1791783 [Gymnopilus junonius]